MTDKTRRDAAEAFSLAEMVRNRYRAEPSRTVEINDFRDGEFSVAKCGVNMEIS